MSKEWLEPVLARHLGRVAAPEELWERIQNPQLARYRSSPWRLAGAPAAALLVAVAVWGIHSRRGVTAGSQALAIQALAREPRYLEFHSGSVAQVRDWIKTRTGLDLPLPAELSPSVRLIGAQMVDGATAEVKCRIGDHDATLLVSKASATLRGVAGHRFLGTESYQGTRVSSWIMRGQMYTLACAAPGDFRVECLLCHADTDRLSTLN